MPPLKRSESAKTTLSMYAQRTGKYQKWLGMVNVFLLLSSFVLLFTGVILRLNYFMDRIGFISMYFEASISFVCIISFKNSLFCGI